MNVDVVIVGAGLTGCTLAQQLAGAGASVLIVEQRHHIGGNVWDEYEQHGIQVHAYGPHIFHTNSKHVWDYLSQFTGWRPYTHRVRAEVEGCLIPVPFNFESIETLFPNSVAARFIEKLIGEFGYGKRVPILELRKSGDSDVRFLADYVYRNVFLNYTKKQWGLSPDELQPSVTERVPVVLSRDDRYFADTYQAMPSEGYSKLVARMLSLPNIRVLTNTKWKDVAKDIKFGKLIYTGPIDEYFEYCFGALPYRTLKFELEVHACEKKLPTAVVNYPNNFDFTRITEFKALTGQIHACTATIKEYPGTHVPGETVPYYPIPSEANKALFESYQSQAERLVGKVMFAGRLGDYSYYNMDQAVARALKLAKDLL